MRVITSGVCRFAAFAVIVFAALTAEANADIRTGSETDPVDAQLHQNVDGTSYRDQDVQKVDLTYDTTGSLNASITFLDPIPEASRTNITVTTSANAFVKRDSDESFSTDDCGFQPTEGDATMRFSAAGSADPQPTGTLSLHGFNGTVPVAVSVTADGRTIMAQASVSTLANRAYRCVAETSISSDAVDGFRLFGPGAYDQATLAACENDADDDGDGKVDLADDGCRGQQGTTEVLPQCHDGIDNDGDGGIDFSEFSEFDDGEDPDCGSAEDDNELPHPCTDGLDNDFDDSRETYIDREDIDSTKPAGQNCDQDYRRHTVPVPRLTARTATNVADDVLAVKYGASWTSQGAQHYLSCPAGEIGRYSGRRRALCRFRVPLGDDRVALGRMLIGVDGAGHVLSSITERTYSTVLEACQLRPIRTRRIFKRDLRAGGFVGCGTYLIRAIHKLAPGARTVVLEGRPVVSFAPLLLFDCSIKRRGNRYSSRCHNRLGDRFEYAYTRSANPNAKKLSIADAQQRVDAVLSNRFGAAYDYASRYDRSGNEISKIKPCSRVSSARVRCFTSWFQGDAVWRGQVTIRRKRGKLRHNFSIRLVDTYCQVIGNSNCVRTIRGGSA